MLLIDFYKKFKNRSKSIEVLGNGLQTKSYISVEDVLRAISIINKKQKNNCEIFNIGLDEVKNVKNSIDWSGTLKSIFSINEPRVPTIK